MPHVAAQFPTHGRGPPVQIPRHPPEGGPPLDTGEAFLALGEGQAPTAGQLGDEGRYHPASLTEPISPRVRIEAQRRRRRPAHHPRPHQQPELPPHLTSSHDPRTHHTPSFISGCCVDFLNPRRVRVGGTLHPWRNMPPLLTSRATDRRPASGRTLWQP